MVYRSGMLGPKATCPPPTPCRIFLEPTCEIHAENMPSYSLIHAEIPEAVSLPDPLLLSFYMLVRNLRLSNLHRTVPIVRRTDIHTL